MVRGGYGVDDGNVLCDDDRYGVLCGGSGFGVSCGDSGVGIRCGGSGFRVLCGGSGYGVKYSVLTGRFGILLGVTTTLLRQSESPNKEPIDRGQKDGCGPQVLRGGGGVISGGIVSGFGVNVLPTADKKGRSCTGNDAGGFCDVFDKDWLRRLTTAGGSGCSPQVLVNGGGVISGVTVRIIEDK